MPDQKAAARSRLAVLRAVAVGAGLLLLVACGSDEPAGDSSVATRDHSQLGKILTDPSGRTLYFADQEADGTIRCVQSCLDMWLPMVVPSGTPPAAQGIGDLGVLHRSDNGQHQLTYQGKPLYRFQLDATAGDVKGDNAQDDFNGTRFVWHAVPIDGGNQPPATEDGSPYGGY